jgi:hypothetical protein
MSQSPATPPAPLDALLLAAAVGIVAAITLRLV